MKPILGIHHITSIVGNPQENVDFYRDVLGLRLVKKTVNFDDPQTYHLYFGNESGDPGTIITFFPWDGARRGVIGNGQVGVTSYAIPTGALEFWERRFSDLKINYNKEVRFNETVICFNDPHGLKLELVEYETNKRNNWIQKDISKEFAIIGFAGATLYSANRQGTKELLINHFGYEEVKDENNVTRVRSRANIGNRIDIFDAGINGEMGSGTVHHIAFRNENDKNQQEWMDHLFNIGLRTTPVKDRNYFKSIYFNEPGNILFEMATDGPGFIVDESFESLGMHLMLPSQYEVHRDIIVEKLLAIK